MSTLTLKTHSHIGKPAKQSIPQTPRGRALFTVDWFLNGRPVLRDHDNSRLDIRGGCSC
jgi:hypothetical protein